MNAPKIIKNLFIVRHGHAAFEASRDFDRPLTTKGIDSTQKTASFIAHSAKIHDMLPQICICSGALRTRQTAQIICQSNGITNITYYDDLYSTNTNQWLQKISEASAQNIVLVGHNPTFSQMLQHWCGLNQYMQAANCALITLEIQEDGITYPAHLHEFYRNE